MAKYEKGDVHPGLEFLCFPVPFQNLCRRDRNTSEKYDDLEATSRRKILGLSTAQVASSSILRVINSVGGRGVVRHFESSSIPGARFPCRCSLSPPPPPRTPGDRDPSITRVVFVVNFRETAAFPQVWSNGDVVINSGGKAVTPATKVILNLVLGAFKVEVSRTPHPPPGSSAPFLSTAAFFAPDEDTVTISPS